VVAMFQLQFSSCGQNSRSSVKSFCGGYSLVFKMKCFSTGIKSYLSVQVKFNGFPHNPSILFNKQGLSGKNIFIILPLNRLVLKTIVVYF